MVPISVTKEQFVPNQVVPISTECLCGNYGFVFKPQKVPFSVEQELAFHFVPTALRKGKNGFYLAF